MEVFMKKKICILIFAVLCLVCSFYIINRNNNSKIVYINYEQLKQYLNQNKSFIIIIGRSDCPDCQILDSELRSNISIPENKTLYYLDVKTYKDEDTKSDIYTNIKNKFNLTWVPTCYKIVDGEISNSLQYLNSNYNNLSIEEQEETLEKYNSKVEEFIKDIN